MFNITRKEQEKYNQEQEVKLNNVFLKEYEELCKKHQRQLTPILRGTNNALIATLQIVEMGVDETVDKEKKI